MRTKYREKENKIKIKLCNCHICLSAVNDLADYY